jgi:predicted SAM-dependent methyltransferase
MVKLDIACGQNKADGFTGIDRADLPGVQIVHDLEVYPWPIADDSVDEARCMHYVEHTNDLIAFMNEVYRILKPQAQILIVAPYYSHMRAWQDPTHKRAISEASFLYFNHDWMVANKLEHYGIKADFDFSYGYSLEPMWASRSEEARNFAIKHYINVIMDVNVIMTKKAKKVE